MLPKAKALLDTHREAGDTLVGGLVLAEQPLMQNVLADLALESEAALALSFAWGARWITWTTRKKPGFPGW